MNDYNSDCELIKREVIKVLNIASAFSYIAMFITNFAPEWILNLNSKSTRCLYHHIFTLVCSIEILLWIDKRPLLIL